MLLKAEREEIVKYGKKLVEKNLTEGTGGNLSILNRDEKLWAISPSGLDYFDIEAEDIVVLDLDGNIIDGDKKPSSEWGMHLNIYKNRIDINAVIHTHSVFSTTISALRETLPAAHYMIAMAGKNVRCAEYASFGSKELGENALEAMEDRNAVLLANHGLLAGSNDLAHTFKIIEEVEYSAEIYYRARSIGKPVILDDKEMETMLEKFKTYGQVTDKNEK